MAHIGFDSTGIEPREAYETLPAGKYVVSISKSDVKTTKAGDGQYLSLEMDVLEGEHKGRKVWDNINFRNPNPKATEIAQRTLSALCHAIGVVKLEDSSQAHGIPIVVKVSLDKKPDGDSRNVVKAYIKIGDAERPAAPGKPANNGQRPPWAAR